MTIWIWFHGIAVGLVFGWLFRIAYIHDKKLKLESKILKNKIERILKSKDNVKKKIKDLKEIKHENPYIFLRTLRFNETWVKFVKENKDKIKKVM